MDSEKRKITGVIFYDTWRIPAEMLDAERFGELVKDFLLWAWDGEEPTKLGETQKMFFNIAKKQAKTDFEKYDAIVEKRREAGKKHTGNQYTKMEQNGTNGTNVPKMEQMEQNGTNGTNNKDNNINNNINNNNDINISSNKIEDSKSNADKSATRTKRPTPEECFEYCKEQGLSTYDFDGQRKSIAQTTAESFYDYYESNGWKVGKNPMKNWKAALNGWIRRDSEWNKKHQQTKSDTIAEQLIREHEEELRQQQLQNL